MTERQEFVHRWCNDVIEKLTTSVADVNNEKALSPSVTQQLLIEIRNMQKALDPEVYIPMYPRFLLDSWDGYDFVDDLLKLAYEYGRIRKGAKFSQGVPES
ncbi:MAG: hypothetical protein RW306_14170 [Geobacteraceae bacterium]|nr:hypothetical protein [Geobacteraceae bacterium]